MIEFLYLKNINLIIYIFKKYTLYYNTAYIILKFEFNLILVCI